jgi:hypothetical protein
MGNLIAAPLNGKRRQHGTTVFLDPATLEPFDDQWAYLPSIARLSANDAATLSRALPDPQADHRVRRLQLPISSKIVPRPAAIIRATFASRITLTANDLGPAMISAVTRSLHSQPGVRCPSARTTQHLGHAALPLQRRQDRRRRSCPSSCPAHASDRPGRLSRNRVADRRQPHRRRSPRIRLFNSTLDRADRHSTATH